MSVQYQPGRLSAPPRQASPIKKSSVIRKHILDLIVFLLGLVLAACTTPGDDTPDLAGNDVYRPVAAPTLAAPLITQDQPAPTIALTSPPPQATPTPSCTSSLRYIEDLTLPDGSFVAPGDLLDKRWRVENNGSCNWDVHYRLKPIAGPPLGAPPEFALFPARAGTQATIQINFTAPAEAGAYRSAWQAYDPLGQAFGDPIFIDIVVAQ